MQLMQLTQVRRMWWCLEHLHAVTYFDERCRRANREAGLRGFWMGYFATRAAPLGPVGPGVVEALFSNFAPAMVRRALPDAWELCEPAALLGVRRSAAAEALRALVPDVADAAKRSLEVLESCVRLAPGSGRPLFCANRDLPPGEDPVAELWQLATTLREHRGDGHVAVLASEGLSGCEPHVLLAADHRIPAAVLRDSRGWTEEEWERASVRLGRLGLLDDSTALTERGAAMRARIEEVTDTLATRAYEPIGEDGVDHLLDVLGGAARGVSSSGVVPYPNPMGLPRFR